MEYFIKMCFIVVFIFFHKRFISLLMIKHHLVEALNQTKNLCYFRSSKKENDITIACLL